MEGSWSHHTLCSQELWQLLDEEGSNQAESLLLPFGLLAGGREPFVQNSPSWDLAQLTAFSMVTSRRFLREDTYDDGSPKWIGGEHDEGKGLGEHKGIDCKYNPEANNDQRQQDLDSL